MQTYFFSKDNIRQFNTNRMVELSGIEPLTPLLAKQVLSQLSYSPIFG